MINNLKEARLKNGYTLEQVAQKLSTTRAAISMYENGKREVNNNLLVKFSELYGVSTDYLLGKETSSNNIFNENTVSIFGYGGKRRDYHLSEENAKLLEQLAEKMSKEKIDGDF